MRQPHNANFLPEAECDIGQPLEARDDASTDSLWLEAMGNTSGKRGVHNICKDVVVHVIVLVILWC